MKKKNRPQKPKPAVPAGPLSLDERKALRTAGHLNRPLRGPRGLRAAYKSMQGITRRPIQARLL